VTQVESYSPRRVRRSEQQQAGGQPQYQGGMPSGRPARGRSTPPPLAYEADRRGSHATPQGQGFSWVVVWTILGALIPGIGLIAAGWRRLGAVLLFVLGLIVVGLAGFAVLGDPRQQAINFAVDPTNLLMLAFGAGVIAIAWVVVVVLTNAELRRYANLTTAQAAFSWIVVAALAIGVGMPAYRVSNYAMITRGVLTSKSVFAGDGDGSSDSSSGLTSKGSDPWAGRPQMNVLLLGSDAGADRTGIRPDTMILASINTKTGKAVMFSLPRSMQHARFAEGSPGARAWPNGYACPDQSCLLNAIWTWADTGAGKSYYKQYKNPGLRATEDAIAGTTGLKINTYVMLNLNGFQDFVDAVGGVTVEVHDRLPIGGNGDPKSDQYHKATGGYIEKGKQHLDGYHALWFARSRWAFDDYNRMKRQRCVIGDVVDQSNPTKLALNFPAIAKALKKNLSTGIKPSDLQAWVDLANRVKSGGVRSVVFDPNVINTVNPDIDKIHELVAAAVKTTAKAKAPAASPSVSPEATASGTTKAPGKTKAPKDPTKAQSLKSVC
jgi:LCP family protein required for cell wall assembly